MDLSGLLACDGKAQCSLQVQVQVQEQEQERGAARRFLSRIGGNSGSQAGAVWVEEGPRGVSRTAPLEPRGMRRGIVRMTCWQAAVESIPVGHEPTASHKTMFGRVWPCLVAQVAVVQSAFGPVRFSPVQPGSIPPTFADICRPVSCPGDRFVQLLIINLKIAASAPQPLLKPFNF